MVLYQQYLTLCSSLLPHTLAMQHMHHIADKRQHVALLLWQQLAKNTHFMYDYKTLRYTLICLLNCWFFILVKKSFLRTLIFSWSLEVSAGAEPLMSAAATSRMLMIIWHGFICNKGWVSIKFDVAYIWILIINNCFSYWIHPNATKWPMPGFGLASQACWSLYSTNKHNDEYLWCNANKS